MEQQREAPSGTASDSLEEPSAPFVERYFWPILLGVIVLGIGASAAVVYTQYSRVDQTLRSIPYFDQASQLATRATKALPYVGTADTSDGMAGSPKKYGSFTRLESLVVNPEGANGRYLAVSLAFEAKSTSVTAELENKKIVVQDAVISHLSEQTVEELSDTAQREKLKQELREETNKILTSGSVNRLYFTEFVLQ
jgi:flagellar FliL protein